jgi:hypothetical protein
LKDTTMQWLLSHRKSIHKMWYNLNQTLVLLGI